jgi:LmbE family N-acetylglucosaminyl deacetylase
VISLHLNDLDSVVALGAHPDDLEIGAGGLLLTLAGARPGIRTHYVLLTGSPDRQQEAQAAAVAFLPGATLTTSLHTLPDGRLPAHWDATKSLLHREFATLEPDLVLAPAPYDAHQDHRLLAELAPTVFRDSLILHYEIPKSDGDFGRPNVYLPLTDDIARRKVELLHACFPSQKARSWWDEEVFLGLARLRGMECHSRYAEAFSGHKLSITVP